MILGISDEPEMENLLKMTRDLMSKIKKQIDGNYFGFVMLLNLMSIKQIS